MGLRESMQNRPALWGGVAAVAIGLAVVGMFPRSKPPAAPQFGEAWFYDLGSGELFAGKNALPPIDAATGAGQGVIAFIYACGACDPASWTLAYIQTFTPQAKAAMQGPSDTPEQMQAKQSASTVGQLVAAPPAKGEKPHWVSSSSADGAAVVARAKIECPALERAVMCQP